MGREMRDEAEKVYEVERVCGRRQKGGRREYLVKWVGYPQSESTWEPWENLDNVTDMIEAFEKGEKLKQGVKRSSHRKVIVKGKPGTSKVKSKPEERKSAPSRETTSLRCKTADLPTPSTPEASEALAYNLGLSSMPHTQEREEIVQQFATPQEVASQDHSSRRSLLVLNPRIENHIFVEGRLFLLIALDGKSDEKLYVSQTLCRERWPDELCLYYERFIKII